MKNKAPIVHNLYVKVFDYISTAEASNQKKIRDHFLTVLEDNESTLHTTIAACNVDFEKKVGNLRKINESIRSTGIQKTNQFRIWLLQKLNACVDQEIGDNKDFIQVVLELAQNEAEVELEQLKADNPEEFAGAETRMKKYQTDTEDYIKKYKQYYKEAVPSDIQESIKSIKKELKKKWGLKGTNLYDELATKVDTTMSEQPKAVQDIASWIWGMVDDSVESTIDEALAGIQPEE
jgi:hypothetical protein